MTQEHEGDPNTPVPHIVSGRRDVSIRLNPTILNPVRCEDCRFRETDLRLRNLVLENYLWCPLRQRLVEKTDVCPAGVRRDDSPQGT